MKIFSFVLGILATKNATDILVYDKISRPLREYFDIAESSEGSYHLGSDNPVKNFIGKVLSCFKCTSVWVALFFTILYFTSKKVYQFMTYWLSFSWSAFKL